MQKYATVLAALSTTTTAFRLPPLRALAPISTPTPTSDALPFDETADVPCKEHMDVLLSAPTMPTELKSFSSEYYLTATRTAQVEEEECAWITSAPEPTNELTKEFLQAVMDYSEDNEAAFAELGECLAESSESAEDVAVRATSCQAELDVLADMLGLDGPWVEEDKNDQEDEATIDEAPVDGAPEGETPELEVPEVDSPVYEAPAGNGTEGETDEGKDEVVEVGAAVGLAVRSVTVLGAVAAAFAVYVV